MRNASGWPCAVVCVAEQDSIMVTKHASLDVRSPASAKKMQMLRGLWAPDPAALQSWVVLHGASLLAASQN